MGEDWIQIDTDLDDKIEVLVVAEKTGTHISEVVGRIVRFWCWASRNTEDGELPGVTVDMLSARFGGDSAFWEAIESAGWVRTSSAGVRVPKFGQRFSQSAKRRLKDRDRKRATRSAARSSNARPQSVRTQTDKSVTRSESETESETETEEIRKENQCQSTGRKTSRGAVRAGDVAASLIHSDADAGLKNLSKNGRADTSEAGMQTQRWLAKMCWPRGMDTTFVEHVSRQVVLGRVSEAFVASAIDVVARTANKNHGGLFRTAIVKAYTDAGIDPPAEVLPKGENRE